MYFFYIYILIQAYMDSTATVREIAFVISPGEQSWINPKWFPVLCLHVLIFLQNNLKLNELLVSVPI